MEVTPRLHSQFVLAVFTGMVAEFQSERRPFSHRNGGRFPAGTLAVFVRNTQLCTLLDPFERNSAMLWLFAVNGLMHFENIVEFCIVFGATQLENVIGVVNLPPGT